MRKKGVSVNIKQRATRGKQKKEQGKQNGPHGAKNSGDVVDEGRQMTIRTKRRQAKCCKGKAEKDGRAHNWRSRG